MEKWNGSRKSKPLPNLKPNESKSETLEILMHLPYLNESHKVSVSVSFPFSFNSLTWDDQATGIQYFICCEDALGCSITLVTGCVCGYANANDESTKFFTGPGRCLPGVAVF